MHPALRPYVARVTEYDLDLGGPGVHRGLPSTALTLVLSTDRPLDVAWAGQPSSRARHWALVSGLHDRPAEIHHHGHQSGVQVDLTIAGARALLGVPAAALAGQIVDLGEVAVALRHLPELLHDVPPGRRGLATEEALACVLTHVNVPEARAVVDRALRCLTRGGRVGDVADQVGYSRRRLAAVVQDECGLTPKTYQRVARFQASRILVGHRPLAELAATCGYSDQAHLTREWVEIAGCPPTTWMREEFPFLQDLSVDGPPQ